MNFLWSILAQLLAMPFARDWLISKAKKTPYNNIVKDGSTYMERYWLFNPYESVNGEQKGAKYSWWPWSIRIHWIRRADVDRHMHDHPWNARTVILKGWYIEERLICDACELFPDGYEVEYWRREGDTARLDFGEYHYITEVPEDGVWTLFITGPYQGTWGFMVDGVKVKFRQYLGME